MSQFDQLHLPCEDTTGNCIGQCHPGYTGSKCDTCAENYEIGYNLSTFFRTEFVTCRKSCPEGYDLPNQGFFMDFPYNITNFDYYDDFQANQSHDQHYNTYPHLCFFASSESLDYNYRTRGISNTVTNMMSGIFAGVSNRAVLQIGWCFK